MHGDTGTIAKDGLHARLQREGFAFLAAAQTRALIERDGGLRDWAMFAASWNDLVVDGYLVDHGRFRRRRHAVFSIGADGIARREAHQPHFQSRDYNRVYGGIERWFEPLTAAVGESETLRSILHFCTKLFGELSPDVRNWRVETHQFRIEARPGEPGLPTPEGMHRDGVDWVLVLMIARHNIASGTTTIHSLAGELLGSFTLATPFDAALVDDARVLHGVTPVEPLDPSRAACRDVLVVTFKRA